MSQLNKKNSFKKSPGILLYLMIAMFIFFSGFKEEEKPQETGSAYSYYLKGKEFLSQGEFEKAEEAFRKAQELLKGKVKYLGIENKGEKKEPEESSSVVSSKKPSLKETFEETLRKAEEAYKKKDWTEAIKLYTHLLLSSPKNPDIYFNLGVCYLNKADYLSAVRAFEKVIRLNKRDAEAYYNLGVLYESFLGEDEKALKYYKKYLRFCNQREEKDEVRSWIKYLEKKQEE